MNLCFIGLHRWLKVKVFWQNVRRLNNEGQEIYTNQETVAFGYFCTRCQKRKVEDVPFKKSLPSVEILKMQWINEDLIESLSKEEV